MVDTIYEILGKEKAEYLLSHTCTTINKDRLKTPSPDFIDKVFVDSDRPNNVLRNLQSLFSHGRLKDTGYLSILPVDQGDDKVFEVVENEYQGLTSDAIKFLEREGVSREDIEVRREVDLRYSGQSYELTMPFRWEGLIAGFHDTHEHRFGWAFPENVVETVNIRVITLGPQPRVEMNLLETGERENPRSAVKTHRRVFTKGQFEECAIYDRTRLLAHDRIVGPALIEEFGSTTYLPPDAAIEVTSEGALMMDLTKDAY